MLKKITIVLLLLVMVTGVTVPAAAQDVPEPDNPLNESEDTRDIIAQVDSQTVVESYEYDADTETMQLDLSTTADTARTVTIMEAIGSDSGSLNIEQIRVRPDETTRATIDARLDRGAAGVVVTSDQGINENNAAVVIHREGSDLPTVSLEFGVLIGIAVMAVGMAIAVHRKYNVEYRRMEGGWKDD